MYEVVAHHNEVVTHLTNLGIFNKTFHTVHRSVAFHPQFAVWTLTVFQLLVEAISDRI